MAKDIKRIGYDDDVSPGHSIGQVSGESCSWKVLGYSVSREPTLDEAVANVRIQTNGLPYLNHMNTEYNGFNAGLFAKNCLVVKGVAYK